MELRADNAERAKIGTNTPTCKKFRYGFMHFLSGYFGVPA
jgi:hypothetical protein